MVGCTSSDENFVVTGPGTTTQGLMTAEVRVVSRIKSATIRLEDMDGHVFASGKGNVNGMVFFRNVTVPTSFRAVSTIGNTELRLDVDNYRENPAVMRLSILSTLQSLYREKHPDLSHEEIDKRIRATFQLPPQLDLSVGLFEPNPVFSDLAFLRGVAANGSWEGFAEEQLARAEEGRVHRFLLTLEALTTPIDSEGANFDPELVSEVEAARAKLQERLGYSPAARAQLQGVLDGGVPPGNLIAPHISAVAGPASLGGQFLLGISTGITGNLIGGGSKALVGWCANQMGLNYGTSGQLQAIEATLTEVLAAVDALRNTVTDQTIRDQIDTLESTFAPVKSATTQLQGQASTFNVSNQPTDVVPGSSLGSLLSTVGQTSWSTLLVTVQGLLVGPDSLYPNLLSKQLTDNLGIDQPAAMYGCPWQSQALLTQIVNAYDHYATYQTMALNMVAEQGHTMLSLTDPVSKIDPILLTFAPATQALKKQRQQFPLLCSTADVLTDLENGIQWYSEIFASLPSRATILRTGATWPSPLSSGP